MSISSWLKPVWIFFKKTPNILNRCTNRCSLIHFLSNLSTFRKGKFTCQVIYDWFWNILKCLYKQIYKSQKLFVRWCILIWSSKIPLLELIFILVWFSFQYFTRYLQFISQTSLKHFPTCLWFVLSLFQFITKQSCPIMCLALSPFFHSEVYNTNYYLIVNESSLKATFPWVFHSSIIHLLLVIELVELHIPCQHSASCCTDTRYNPCPLWLVDLRFRQRRKFKVISILWG
jgi:hypothetical protein